MTKRVTRTQSTVSLRKKVIVVLANEEEEGEKEEDSLLFKKQLNTWFMQGGGIPSAPSIWVGSRDVLLSTFSEESLFLLQLSRVASETPDILSLSDISPVRRREVEEDVVPLPCNEIENSLVKDQLDETNTSLITINCYYIEKNWSTMGYPSPAESHFFGWNIGELHLRSLVALLYFFESGRQRDERMIHFYKSFLEDKNYAIFVFLCSLLGVRGE